MQADWTVECGADDPTVAVPWANQDGSLRYIDLHAAGANVNQIPEAARYPCLAAALRRWNQADAPVFTAKCDVWNYAADLFDAEDLPGSAYAQASYIDLLPRDEATFSSFAACQKLLRACTNAAQRIELADCRCEWILRLARIFPMTATENAAPTDVYREGFATTLYVWGYGASPHAAETVWASALASLIEPVILTMAS